MTNPLLKHHSLHNTRMSQMAENNYLFNRSFLVNQRKDYCETIRSNYTSNYLAVNHASMGRITYNESKPLAQNNCCVPVKEIIPIIKRRCSFCLPGIRRWKSWLFKRVYFRTYWNGLKEVNSIFCKKSYFEIIKAA